MATITSFVFVLFISIFSFAHNNKKDLTPYIVQSNPVNLQEVRINIENYQPTNKPVKKFEINYGDGKKETKNEDVFYKYKNKGTYNLVVKTWDAQNKLTTYQKELNLDKAHSIQDVPNSGVLGPMWIKENKKYKLNIQNESELYLVTLTKLPSWNDFFGYKWYKKHKLCKRDYNVEINNIEIFKEDEVSCHSTQFKRIVKLQKDNIIKLEARGHSFKYWWREGFKIEIHAVNIIAPASDTTKPILLSSQSSNAISNNPNVQISVQDVSSTITKIWNNNQELLFETPDKNFNLSLQEGVNNFVIQSEDAFGNKSELLNLSNIILDTQKPIISLSLNSEYIYSTYPQNFTMSINTNEDVQRLTVNNQDAQQVGPRSFSYTLNVQEPQAMSFSIKAYDLAGNESLEERTINFGIDNIAPSIGVSLASNQFTNQQVWPVVISDNSSVSTEVYRDEVLILTTEEKSFELSLNEGVNNFRIRSVDEYGNRGTDLILQNITYDITPPVLLGLSNMSFNFRSLPQVVNLQFQSSETLQRAEVNSELAELVGSGLGIKYDLLINSQGPRSVSIRAVDLAGNITQQSILVDVNFDNVKPTLTLSETPVFVESSEVLVSFQVQDASDVKTTIKLNNQVLAIVAEKNFSYVIPLEAGVNSIEAFALDEAGNISETVARAIYRDNAAPVIISNFKSGDILIDLVPVSITITDDSDTIITRVYKNDEMYQTLHLKNFDLNLTEGENNFKIVSTDAAGNVSQDFNLNITYEPVPNSEGRIVFGPQEYMSVNGELTARVDQINLGGLQAGMYLLKIQNGRTGPVLLANCNSLSPAEARRQCEYENLLDGYKAKLFRVDRMFAYINGVKTTEGTLVNKSVGYREYPIRLTEQINELKIEVQDNPEAKVTVWVEQVSGPSLPPKALFNLNTNTSVGAYKFNFDASASFDPLGRAIKYEWYLNNALISNAKIAEAELSLVGDHILKLVVTNSLNLKDELQTTLTVKPYPDLENINQKPIIKLAVSYPNQNNLREVHVSTNGSYDPDGLIQNTVIEFSDGFSVAASEVNYTFPEDNIYSVKVTMVDNEGLSSEYVKLIPAIDKGQLAPIASRYNKTFYYELDFSEQNIFEEEFSLPPLVTDSLYKVVINNADGNEYPITESCEGNLAAIILCEYHNLLSRIGLNMDRVKYADMIYNGLRITPDNALNENVKTFEAYVVPEELNHFILTLKGNPFSFLNVEVLEMGVREFEAPILTADIESGPVIERDSFWLNVEDDNRVDVDVYLNGIFLYKQPDTQGFIVQIQHNGGGTYSFKAKDVFGNESSLDISLIVDGGNGPVILTDINESVTLRSKMNVTIQDESDTHTDVYIDNEYLYTTELKQFSIDILKGDHLYRIVATNAGGDYSNLHKRLDADPDYISPKISIASKPKIITTPSYNLDIKIEDDRPTTTQIYVDDVLVLETEEKEILYQLVFNTQAGLLNTENKSRFSFVNLLLQKAHAQSAEPVYFNILKKVKIVATDISGNISESIFDIIFNNEPFKVKLITPLNNSVLKKKSFRIQVESNKMLSTVLIENAEAEITENLATIDIVADMDGEWVRAIKFKDQDQNEFNLPVYYEIRSRSLANWDYADMCPVNGGQ